MQGSEWLSYIFELEFIIEIACIFGKGNLEYLSSCVVQSRVQCFQIISLELSGKGFLTFFFLHLQYLLVTFKNLSRINYVHSLLSTTVIL